MRCYLFLLVACTADRDPGGGSEGAADTGTVEAQPGPVADVVDVTSTGAEGAYTVLVAIRSDETGCEQYADWWEIVSVDGELVYRRILDHSHPDEQPFTRGSEEPVAVGADEEVLVRAHLHHDASGYGGLVMRGTFGGGFVAGAAEPGFAAELESAAPQPESCLF